MRYCNYTTASVYFKSYSEDAFQEWCEVEGLNCNKVNESHWDFVVSRGLDHRRVELKDALKAFTHYNGNLCIELCQVEDNKIQPHRATGVADGKADLFVYYIQSENDYKIFFAAETRKLQDYILSNPPIKHAKARTTNKEGSSACVVVYDLTQMLIDGVFFILNDPDLLFRTQVNKEPKRFTPEQVTELLV